MPVRECTEDGKPGYSWGNQTCYTYEAGNERARREAKRRAYIQGAAARANGAKAMTDMFIVKQFASEIAAPPEIDPATLARISAMALEPVPAEQVFVARAKLANDQIDRSHERFPVEYLQRFAETIPGKALLPGHDRTAVPIGRWIDATVERDAGGAQHLMARFYVPAQSDIATRLRMGIAKDTSISFRAAGRTCDLCGSPYDGPKGCEHEKGREYDGKLCTVTYSGDTRRVEAVEGSLVWLACQNGASVVGSKAVGEFGGRVMNFDEWAEDDDPMNTAELEAKVIELTEQVTKAEALAAESQKCREWLVSEIARKMGAATGSEIERDLMLKTLKSANFETLEQYNAIADERFNAKYPPQPQTKPLGDGAVPAPPPADQPPPATGGFDPLRSMRRAAAGD